MAPPIPLHLLTRAEREGAIVALAHLRNLGMQMDRNAKALEGRDACRPSVLRLQESSRTLLNAVATVEHKIA